MCQGESSFSYHISGQYVRIDKRKYFLLLNERAAFNCRYKSLKEKQPNCNYLRKQTLKSRIVLFKLCKENHRVQSKILDVLFSIESSFETEIGCFVTRLRTFRITIRPHIFAFYNETTFIVERTPHSHIQRYVCHKHDAHERICLPIFNITVISIHFDYFIFCFKFIFLSYISSSVTFIYYFSVRVKPIQNAVTKRKKPTVVSSWHSQ